MYDVSVSLDVYDYDKENTFLFDSGELEILGLKFTGSGMGLWEGAARDWDLESRKELSPTKLDGFIEMIRKEFGAKVVNVIQKRKGTVI